MWTLVGVREACVPQGYVKVVVALDLRHLPVRHPKAGRDLRLSTDRAARRIAPDTALGDDHGLPAGVDGARLECDSRVSQPGAQDVLPRPVPRGPTIATSGAVRSSAAAVSLAFTASSQASTVSVGGDATVRASTMMDSRGRTLEFSCEAAGLELCRRV